MCRKPARAVKQELYVSPLLGEVCTLPKDLEPEANAESAFRDMVLARSHGAFSVEAEAVVRHMADRTFVSPPAFIGNLGPIDLGPEYLESSVKQFAKQFEDPSDELASKAKFFRELFGKHFDVLAECIGGDQPVAPWLTKSGHKFAECAEFVRAQIAKHHVPGDDLLHLLLEDLVAIQRGQLAESRSELEDAVRLVYEARARATALADKLQPLADENRALLAENATLRRKLERGGR